MKKLSHIYIFEIRTLLDHCFIEENMMIMNNIIPIQHLLMT